MQDKQVWEAWRFYIPEQVLWTNGYLLSTIENVSFKLKRHFSGCIRDNIKQSHAVDYIGASLPSAKFKNYSGQRWKIHLQ